MDNLFEQFANISKAHAYDILADQVKELKEVIKQLIEAGDLEDLEFTTPADTLKFKLILKRAKILAI